MYLEVFAADSVGELNDCLLEWQDVVEKCGVDAFRATKNSAVGRQLCKILQPRYQSRKLVIHKLEKYRIKTKFVAKVHFDLEKIE